MRFTFFVLLFFIATIGFAQTDTSDSQSSVDSQEIQDTVDVKIYPNPVKDRIYFESRDIDGDARITFFDVLGKVVKRDRINILTMRQGMDVSELRRGVYLVKVDTGRASVTQKMVKN